MRAQSRQSTQFSLYWQQVLETLQGDCNEHTVLYVALARALVKLNPDFRKPLKSAGMLTRDPRMVERKKYGQPKARKRFQYSKR